jgi:hypothetical protein
MSDAFFCFVFFANDSTSLSINNSCYCIIITVLFHFYAYLLFQSKLDAITDPTKREERENEIREWFDMQNPPTFRRSDLKHLAQYRQMIQTHGRIYNFRLRIGELEQTIDTLKKDAASCIEVLEFLHRNIFGLERDLNSIEQ